MANSRGRRKKSSAYIRKRKRTRTVVLVLALLTLFIGFLISRVIISLPYESIDLCNLAVIDFGGYNTAGTAEVLADDAAIDALLAKVKNDYNDATFHNTHPNDEDYLMFRQSLKFTLDKTNGLANGSVVTINCDYDKKLAKELKIEITCTTREVTVGGLPTVTKISVDDVFANLDVSFSGVSPNLVVSMQNNSSNPFVQGMGFSIENPKECYAEGDIITVRANYTEELSLSTKYVVDVSDPSLCTKEYEVTGDSKYMDEASELTESIIEKAINAGMGAFKDANEYGVRIFCEANLVPVYINKKATFVYGKPKVVSAYFKTVLPEKAGSLGYNYNDLDIIYSVVISQADGVSCTAYAAVRFSDIIKNGDGTYEYDFSSPKILSESYFAANVKKNVTDSYAGDYDITKVR